MSETEKKLVNNLQDMLLFGTNENEKVITKLESTILKSGNLIGASAWNNDETILYSCVIAIENNGLKLNDAKKYIDAEFKDTNIKSISYEYLYDIYPNVNIILDNKNVTKSKRFIVPKIKKKSDIEAVDVRGTIVFKIKSTKGLAARELIFLIPGD